MISIKPAVPRGELREQVAMARHTTWRVGGPARRVYRPADVDDLAAFLAGRPENEPLVWVGLGSNLLVRDGGIDGTVILTADLDRYETVGERRVRAEAGVACARLAKVCAQQGFGASEFLAGIPGTLGGALAMNAGAFGGETWERVVEVETVDRRGERHRRTPADFEVAYRHVRGRPDEWFVAATLAFGEDTSEAITERVRALLAQRSATQPVGKPSCGSVFRNPPGDYAARLIEAAGLKGFQRGGAVVSEKHANFILNTGSASAADIEYVIEHVRQQVAERFGVALQPEVRIVGEASHD